MSQGFIFHRKPCFNREKDIVDIPSCHPHEVCDPGGIESFLPQEFDRNPPCIYCLRISPFAQDLTGIQIGSICDCLDDVVENLIHIKSVYQGISQIVPKRKRMVSHPLTPIIFSLQFKIQDLRISLPVVILFNGLPVCQFADLGKMSLCIVIALGCIDF